MGLKMCSIRITIWHVPYIIPVGPDAGYAMHGNTYYHYTGSIVTDKKLIAIDEEKGGCGTYGNIGFDEDGHILTSDGPALVKLNKNTGGLMVSSVVNLVSSGTVNAGMEFS